MEKEGNPLTVDMFMQKMFDGELPDSSETEEEP
jgi:hypothetical protein